MQFHCIKISEYFPEPYEPSGRDINVKVDLSNYATKFDLKNAAGINTSKLSATSDLVSLKTEVDKLDIDKLKSVPINLSNLKSKIDKLNVVKLETTPVDLSKLSTVVKSNAKIKNVEDKISDITNLGTKTTLSAKINEVKVKIPSITNLATTTALSAVENKIADVSNLVKKLTITQKLMKLKRQLLIIVMINALLLKNLISYQQKIL